MKVGSFLIALVTFILCNSLNGEAQFRLFPRPPVIDHPTTLRPTVRDEMAWCPVDHPARHICRPIGESPAIDCDDKAWLVCLQFPGACWMFDFYAPDSDVGGGQRSGHRISIIRSPTQNPDGTWRFCAVEPYGLDPVYCWDSPSDSPEPFPTEDIRRAICDFPGYDWWVDCDTELPEVRPPFPGDTPYYCDPGEAPWYECGSGSHIRTLCDRFNDYPSMECLPKEMRECLQDCDELDGGENGQWPDDALGCLPGNIALCRNSEGKLSTRFCCSLSENGPGGAWCLIPYERYHLATCASLIGQSCDPHENTLKDCFEEGETSPFGLLPTTVRCERCEGSSTGYCWRWPPGHSSSSARSTSQSSSSSSSSAGSKSSQASSSSRTNEKPTRRLDGPVVALNYLN